MILVRDLQPALGTAERPAVSQTAKTASGCPCAAVPKFHGASPHRGVKCSRESIAAPLAIYRRETQSRRRRCTNFAATDAASTSRSSGASRKTLPVEPQKVVFRFLGIDIGCHVLQKY